MTNPFYTATGAPVQESRGTSPAVRNEFALLQTAFDEVFDAIDIGAASGTSTTSLLVGTGSKSFTIQAGRAFSPGQSVVLAYNVTPTTQMAGTITSYNRTTGAVVMNVTGSNGSGTYADWTLSLSPSSGAALGANIFTGAQDWATGANIASASTVNLDTATGNRVHITGTTTITGWTLTRGPRTVIFDNSLQLTYNATSNRLNSNGANVTVEAGDMAYIESDGTTVFVNVIKKNGAAVAGGTPAFGALGTKQVAAAIASTTANAICNLDSTRNFRVRRNASDYLIVDLLDQTGAVLGSSSVVESVAITAGNPCIVPLTSTTALMSWQTSWNTKAVHISYSGISVTIGTVFVVEAVSGGPTSVMAFSATKVAVIYPNSTTNMRYRVLTPGSTITAVAAAGTLLATNVSFLTRAAAMSDTQGLVAFATGTTSVTVAPVTEAAGVLTLGTQTTAWSSADPNSGNADVIYTGANSKFVGVFGAGAGGANYTGWAVVFQISGTGSAAVVYMGPATFIPPSGTGAEFRRLARVSNSVVVSVCSTNGSTGNIAAQALQVSGMQASVVAGESLNTLSNGGQIGVCVCGASLLFAYADSTNSNYPTTVALPLGTVGS